MKHLNSIAALGLAALSGFAFTSQRPVSIAGARWLTGCWEARDPRRTITEQWTPPRGRAMLGTSRTISGDSLVAYEFVVVREQGNRLAYHAHPAGQHGATFLSTVVTDSSIIFENPAHDFPQQVGYARHGSDSTLAWISGVRGGTTRRIVFPYRRVDCE